MTAFRKLKDIFSMNNQRQSAGGSAVLHLWFPQNHDLDNLVFPFLDVVAAGYHWDYDEGHLEVPSEEEELSSIVLSLGDLLKPEESRDVKALVLPSGTAPSASDLSRMMIFSNLLAHHQAQWIQELMDRACITSHFQPIVHAENTSRIFAFEALLRGIREDGTLIPPQALLQSSRQSGMLLLLDQCARRTALREFSQQNMPASLFINFSPIALAKSDLYLKSTVQLVEELKIDPKKVVFEIVETDQIEDLEAFSRVLSGYREAGFRIALDDVGSGYSGLNLLHVLRPEFVKIDMALVRNVHKDSFKAMITRNLIDLARHLNIHTIAEGVECEGEFRWLRSNAVNFMQGYLFARPSSKPVRYTVDLNAQDKDPQELSLVEQVIRQRMQQKNAAGA